MGCFDEVIVPCPKCGATHEFQSKGGDCSFNTYTLKDAPKDVMSDVNRHAPVLCTCGALIKVKKKKRKACCI